MNNNCFKCDISVARKNIVWGHGLVPSSIMFVGEAPGYHEDKFGIPFIGMSGLVLTNLLNNINLTRKEVYITNLIRCRPPNNRIPTNLEIRNCLPHLLNEVEKVNPRIIVTLGVTALSLFDLQRSMRLGYYHGYPFVYGNRVILPTYHPSYVVRDKSRYELMQSDFSMLSKLYEIVNPFYSL